MLTATVSGSFHRHINAIGKAVEELMEFGVKVLSPQNPRIVGSMGEFLFVASDRFRSVRLVQDRHLESINASDFLWLVAPDGYVGQSASMELGFAVAMGIKVFSTTQPTDLTLRQYVHQVQSMRCATEMAASHPASNTRRMLGVLINPHDSLGAAYDALQRMDANFSKLPHEVDESVAHQFYSERDGLVSILQGFTQKL